MCGKKDVETVKALVEGVEMNVCPACARYGQRLSDHSQKFSKNVKKKTERKSFKSHPDDDKRVVPDFAKRIKEAREKSGMTQQQLADKLNEKESQLHKFESGRANPNLTIARKIARLFNITLVETIEEESMEEKKDAKEESASQKSMTMGDFLKEAMDKKK